MYTILLAMQTHCFKPSGRTACLPGLDSQARTAYLFLQSILADLGTSFSDIEGGLLLRQRRAYFGPYGRFLPFVAFDLHVGTIVCMLALRGLSVGFVTDSVALGINRNSVLLFFNAQVSAVAIYTVLIAS